MLLEDHRQEVITYCKKMVSSGLTNETSGNISILCQRTNHIAISPSGMDYFALTPKDIVVVDKKGKLVDGTCKPSSELFFHLEVYKKRPDVFAVCHTHSSYATTVSCVETKLPPIHYTIAYGGKEVPVVPYKRFGSKELALELGKKISNYNAVLLANHGVIAIGKNIHLAYQTADAIEYVAKIYCQAKALGQANIIAEKEMKAVINDFKTYGQKKESTSS